MYSPGTSSSAWSGYQDSEPPWLVVDNFPPGVSELEALDLLQNNGAIQALKVLPGAQTVAFVRMFTVEQTDVLVAALPFLQTGQKTLKVIGRAYAGMHLQ